MYLLQTWISEFIRQLADNGSHGPPEKFSQQKHSSKCVVKFREKFSSINFMESHCPVLFMDDQAQHQYVHPPLQTLDITFPYTQPHDIILLP